MDFSPLLDALNAPQRDAVCAPPCHQLILAGAGSGKTRVLVHRIAYLMGVLGVPGQQILAVTFTNKAAREMKERLNATLATSAMNAGFMPWLGTFHSIAHRLLSMHWQEAQLPQNFQILDSDDQLRLVKRVYASLQIDEKRWPERQAQHFINQQKDEGLRAAQLPPASDPYSRTYASIYTAYEQICQQAGLVDFAELLLRSHELWQNNPALLQHYQTRFAFVLVDEFQDTNAVQYAWLRKLAGESCWVTAVGDDDQSIYGWRGAKIENIQQFERDFPGTQCVRLEQNYRSSATILAAANAVIAKNQSRMGKSLWTDAQGGDKIDLYSAFNEQDEARFLAERIGIWRQSARDLASVAVLYRSNAQSRTIEEALLREGIAYRIYGGQRFYDRLEIKNALAYLRLILNRHDDTAFERVMNVPPRALGEKTLEALRTCARDSRTSLYHASRTLLTQGLAARASSALSGFLNLLDRLEAGAYEQDLPQLVDSVIDLSGLMTYHASEKGERGQARVDNLRELVNACREFQAEDADLSPLAAFVSQATLDAGDQQADVGQDAVHLMTLHSAKGLEFPLVFMVGMEENLFPHKMSSDTPSGLEEERRLCYVGITRAREKLVLTHAEVRRLYGSESQNPLSRFVREIPGECLQDVRIKSTIVRPAQWASHSVQVSKESVGDSGLRVGQRVAHAKFGEGVILQAEGQGAGARVHVAFSDLGAKWLMVQYAKLMPI